MDILLRIYGKKYGNDREHDINHMKDVVEYTKNRFSNVILSLITIILPVFLMIVTYIVLNLITSDDQLSGRAALGVLALSMIGMALCSYKLSKIRCDYKIISKV